MNNKQFSNEKNAAIKHYGQANTNFKGKKRQLEEKPSRIFDHLINAIEEKDKNLQKTKDVFVKFIEKWKLSSNENWKQDLYKFYAKESKQKQCEIRLCLLSYVQTASRFKNSHIFKLVSFRELKNYFVQRTKQFPEYQTINQRLLKQMKLKKKNASLISKQTQSAKRPNTNIKDSILSYLPFKWFSSSYNQIQEQQQEAESFLTHIHND